MSECLCKIPLKIVEDAPIHLRICSDSSLNFTISESIETSEYEDYEGPYSADPSFSSQTLETADKHMTRDVVINAIEVSRTTNPSGGTTVYIGGIING